MGKRKKAQAQVPPAWAMPWDGKKRGPGLRLRLPFLVFCTVRRPWGSGISYVLLNYCSIK